MVTIRRPASSYTARPIIWRSDINLSRLEPIELGRGLSATFTYNEDFDTKRQGTMSLREPGALQPLADWIVAELEVRDDVGGGFTVPLGHMVAIDKDNTQNGTGRTASVDLRDLSWILRQATITEEIVAPAGADHGATARQMILDFGVPPSLVNIPNSGTLINADILPDEKDDMLSFLTRILAGGAMYQPWVAVDHRLTSMKARDVSVAPSDQTIGAISGIKILPTIQNKPEISGVRNQITVRKATPGEPMIEATATVTNEGSPAHPVNIGRRMGTNRPIILGRIDQESAIATEAEAQALANARLSVAASFLDRLNLDTYPDPLTLDGHKILNLDPGDTSGVYYPGNWLQRTWSITIGQGAPIVKRELTQTVSWR